MDRHFKSTCLSCRLRSLEEMERRVSSKEENDALVGTLWRLCHGKKPMHEHDLLNLEAMCEDSQRWSATACKYLLEKLSKGPKHAKHRALEITDILFAKSLRFREEVLSSIMLFVRKTLGSPADKCGQDGGTANVSHSKLESIAMDIFRKWIERFGGTHGRLLVLKKYLEARSAKYPASSSAEVQRCSETPDYREQNATLKAQLFEKSKSQFNELYSKVKLAIVSLDNAMNLLVPSVELGEPAPAALSAPSSNATVENIPVTVTLRLRKTEVTKTVDNNDLIKNATGLYQQIRMSYQPAVRDAVIRLRRSSCTRDLCTKAEELLSEMTSVINKFSEVEFVSASDFDSDSDFEEVAST